MKAPELGITNTNGETVVLSNFKTRVVLFFYPKANTPGWINEATSFRDLNDQFDELGVNILGISKDSLKSQQNFKMKYDLPFELLSDDEETVCRAYGVLVEKSMFGKKYMGIERSTFVVDYDGEILKEFRNVKIDGHAAEVLEFLKV